MTWDDMADLYDRNFGGRRARTLPMETVADALLRADLVRIDREGYYYEAGEEERA